MPFHRYVALGDSFTEGVGDDDETRPHGVRGWADRVAEVLATQTDELGYANLAIRGRKLLAILDEQVEPAIALGPDLVTLHAGANDVLRPRVDLDDLAAAYDAAVGRLCATGATVAIFTCYDPGGSGLYAALRGRFALFNEHVREIADRHGTTLVDLWRLRGDSVDDVFAADRMHLNARGHSVVAATVLDALGVEHTLDVPDPMPAADVPLAVRLRADAAWAREHAVPWVHRRLTGRSSGDGLSPRRPTLAPVG
ncbi:SGNH/GDSL hydrolase family protein [Nocardioides marmoraquaticus]